MYPEGNITKGNVTKENVTKGSSSDVTKGNATRETYRGILGRCNQGENVTREMCLEGSSSDVTKGNVTRETYRKILGRCNKGECDKGINLKCNKARTSVCLNRNLIPTPLTSLCFDCVMCKQWHCLTIFKTAHVF